MDEIRYFQMMRDTSDITDNIILDSIKKRFSGNLCDLVIDLPKRRAESGFPKSRPAIFRFAYETAGGKDWAQYKDVAAALEMLNISTYSLNNVLDDKGGEKSKQQRNNECIVSMIQRELAQELLRKGVPKLEQFVKTNEKFSEINLITSGVGQFLDGNTLRECEQDYIPKYTARCEGLTGKFMQNISTIAGILAGAGKEDLEHLAEYGRNYGIIIQAINDLGDFLPSSVGKQSVGKVYQDQYSDLRHGCLTLPAWQILQKGTDGDASVVYNVSGNLCASENNCAEVTKSIVRLGIVDEVKRFVTPFAKKAKKELHHLPKSEARDFLSTSLLVHRINKFYGSFRGLKF